jgi:hypothetical protein
MRIFQIAQLTDLENIQEPRDGSFQRALMRKLDKMRDVASKIHETPPNVKNKGKDGKRHNVHND